MDPRWWTSQLPLELEPQYTLIVICHLVNDTPAGTMAVPRVTMKVRVGIGPNSWQSLPLPKISGMLLSLITL